MISDDEVFAEALLRSPLERAGYLARACDGDAGLRARIEALLANHAQAQAYFERPLVNGAPSISNEERAGNTIARYALREKIGEGGCGVVWLAEQSEPVKRRVALKVIKLGMDTKEVIARFEAERQALALMDHPNIAKVHDGGATESGRPFFVMELVRGVPITRYCDEARLSTEERLKLFIDVCHAIQHAHQKGIIHRDIKPSNILVTLHDDVAVPKVIDFGIAKATQGRLTDATVYTAFAQFIGTPAYMSPEQAEFNALDVDTQSDIYSLGVLLYELLTGRPPFDPKTLASSGLDEVRRIIREVEPPRPSTRVRTRAVARATCPRSESDATPARGECPCYAEELRGDLDWIVMKALEKNRTRRYENASAFAADVRRYLAHEPVLARPPSAAYTLQKLFRRHRIAFASATAIASALILGAMVSTWQAIRATRAEAYAWEAEAEQTRLRKTAEEARGAETLLRRLAETQELAARRRAYASDINLIQQALAAENLGRAQSLLDRQRPQPGEKDLRGWEWRYLWQFCQSDALSVLTVKPDAVINSLAVSPDGSWLAAGEERFGGLSLWNLRTHEEIRVPAGRSAVRVAFSPREPLVAFTFIADTAPFSRVRLWDLNARAVVREIEVRLGGACTGLFFSEDGQTLIASAASTQNEIGLWRVADGRKLASFPTGPTGGDLRWSAFAVTRDHQLAAYRTAANDGMLHVIDLTMGKERWAARAADEFVQALAFSPDGKILASGAGFTESAIRLWDVASGQEIGRLEGHRRFVGNLVFWPDGRTLASGGGDHTIRIWDVAEHRLLRTLHGHKLELNSLALMPDQRTLVSGGRDGAIMFWNAMTDRQPPAFRRIPGAPVTWRFSSDSEALIAVDASGRVTERRGRNLETEKTLLEVGRVGPANTPNQGFSTFNPFASLEIGRDGINMAIMAADRPLIAVWNTDRVLRVWDWERGTRVQEFRDAGTQGFVLVRFIRQGRALLLTRQRAGDFNFQGQAKWLEEWEVESGRKVREWLLPPTPNASTPSISRDEKYFIVGLNAGRFTRDLGGESDEEALVRTEFATGEQKKLRTITREAMGGAGFSADGALYAVGSDRGLVDVVDIAAWRKVATLSGVMAGMYSPTFSADGERLAVGGSGLDALTIWDVNSFERLLTLSMPNSVVSTLAFSPDGNALGARGAGGNMAGGGPNGAFYLWRAPSWAEIAAAEKEGQRR